MRRLVGALAAAALLAGCGAAAFHRSPYAAGAPSTPSFNVTCHGGTGTLYLLHRTRLPTLGPVLAGSRTPAQIDMSRLPDGRLAVRCIG